MKKQDIMMGLVWLLNAAAHDTFQLKNLYIDFLRKQQLFTELRHDLSETSEQRIYLEKEIKYFIGGLTDLRGKVDEVLAVFEKIPEEEAKKEGLS